MCARYITPCQIQTVHLLRNKAAIGNGISLFLLKCLLASRFIQAVPRQIVNVEVKARPCHHPIVKYSGLQNILLRDGAFAFKMPRLPDSDQRGGADQIAVFKPRNDHPQKFDDTVHLLPANECGPGQILCLRSVNSGTVCHVTGDYSRKSGFVKQYVAGRLRQILTAQRL